jgi:hypothetical protein
MFTFAKILCLGAIGNYFMVNILLGQIGFSEIHENLMGMTQTIHCGSMHPSLSMVDTTNHYGISVAPSPLGISELTRLSLCGRYIYDTLVALHIKTDIQSIHQLTILRWNLSSAWNIQDSPIIPGIALQSESIAFDDGVLHCTELNMGIGTIFIPNEQWRVGILFHYPITVMNEVYLPSYTQPLLTIGLGYNPLDDIALDIDFLSSTYNSGLKPMISWKIVPHCQITIGFSLPHSSGSIGLSMLIDDIFVQATLFNHLQLGYSWQMSMRYCPN